MEDKIKKYFEYISETLDNPYGITWKDNDKTLLGIFYSMNNEYLIECLEQFDNNWSFVFYIKDNDEYITQSIKNEDNIFRVLATIKNAIEYLYNIKKPNSIIFTSLDKNKVRSKLYKDFSEKFSKKYNLNFNHYNSLSYTDEIDIDIYILYKDLNDSQKSDLIKSIRKIIEEDKL